MAAERVRGRERLFYARFDLMNEDGRCIVVNEAGAGRLGVAAMMLPRLDRRSRAMAVLFRCPGEEEAAPLDFAAETVVDHFAGLLQQEFDVPRARILWVDRGASGQVDWLLPSYSCGRLAHLDWRPVVMPPLPPRTEAALLSVFPEASTLFWHIRQREAMARG